jgi:hypothetical protein
MTAPPPEEKVYLLCSNTTTPESDQAIFNYIRDAAHIADWWNYLPGIFIFRTRRPAYRLQEDFFPFLSGRQFLIIEVNPLATGGWLAGRAWDWLNNGGRSSPQNVLAALTALPPHRT